MRLKSHVETRIFTGWECSREPFYQTRQFCEGMTDDIRTVVTGNLGSLYAVLTIKTEQQYVKRHTHLQQQHS